MTFLDDESVQSWIYRNIFLSGATDYSSVIGNNSYWKEIPHLSPECNINFKNIDDLKLLDFFRKSNISQKKSDIFDDPTSYISEAKFVLGKRYPSPNTKGTISIGYCTFCISNSITKHGFGYFKASWLNQKKCSVHNIKLNFVPITKRTNGLQLIRNIISGKKSNLQGRPNNINRLPAPITLDYYIMPCILMEFYWVASSSESNIFPKPSCAAFYYKNGTRKHINESFLHIKYTTYSSIFPLELKRFLKNKAEIIIYRFGLNQKLSFSENILKSKKANCSKCHNSYLSDNCFKNPIIIKKNLDLNKSYLNNKYKLCGIFSPD